MTIRRRERQLLEALAQARRDREDIADLLDFHLALTEVQLEAKARVSGDIGDSDSATRHQRPEDGLAALTFEQLPIEADTFRQLVEEITGILADHSPEWAEIAEKAEIPPGDALMDSARVAFERRGAVDDPEPKPSGLIALSTEFTLVPYLKRAAEIILPCLDQAKWLRGYLPICCASPDFAILDEESGATHLVCSRCESQWHFVRLKCPFCGTVDTSKLQYYLSEDEAYRLYVCKSCNHYIKAKDLRKTRSRSPLPVERILTVAMDEAARGEGYTTVSTPR